MRHGFKVVAPVLFIGIALVLWTSISDPQMHSTRYLSGFVAALATTATAQTSLDKEIDAKWHAPDLKFWDTSLKKTIHATGTYGFIFNSSHLPKGVKYGTYDYCNMPHVRRSEYKVPPREYKLEYVEVIHRHHKRTPYGSNLFPAENPPYDCSNAKLFYYGSTYNVNPVDTFWTPLWTQQNPFTTIAQGSNCQFPQLTAGGLEDSRQHGQDLFDVYHDLLSFIPAQPSAQVKFRVTNNVITSQVAGALTSGMYPRYARDHESLSLLIENSAIDSLEPKYSCAGASSLSSSYGVGSTDPTWLEHLTKTQPLRDALNAISGVNPNDSGWSQSWDHYFDNLSSRQCHGFPLPSNSSASSSAKQVTQAQADEVYRLGQYEYAYLYRVAKQSLRFGTGSFGVWAAEFLGHVAAVTSGKSTVKYFHNVAHDGSMSRLLAILQAEHMFWPGMGSELVFEIYSRESSGYGYGGYGGYGGGKQWFVRILFGGQIFKSSTPEIGEANLIPLEKLVNYIKGLVGEKAKNVVALCNGN